MATLWDVVTSNSTLSVDPGNNFWDHMNNQNSGTGSGIVIYNESKVRVEQEFAVRIDEDIFNVSLEED